MTHWQLYGHDWAVDYLQKGMIHNRVRHAYLITGVDGIGKSTLAHEFAKALNCMHEDVTQRPCGECRSCKKLDSGNHPDMIYAENDPNSGVLKIEAIRAVTRQIALKPYETRYRIAVFENFDKAGGQAQDSLLKTLEEPPRHAVLLLVATSLAPILSTITSRSQIIHLRPVSAETIRAVLTTRYEVEDDLAARLGRISGGRIAWAINAAHNPDTLEDRTRALEILDDLIRGDRNHRFKVADEFGKYVSKTKDKQWLATQLELWLSYWRDLLLMAENSPIKPCNDDFRVSMEQVMYGIEPEDALRAVRATRTMLNNLHYNINVRLSLEVMFLDYPGLP